MDYTDFVVDRAQHMRPLEYDLSENYNALVRYMHDMGVLDNVPVATLGPASVLSASDALAAPLRSLVVGGNSTQTGTPTPDAPVPIQSVDDLTLEVRGKNLFDPSHILDASGWTVSDGVYTGTSNALYVKYGPNTPYHVSGLLGTPQAYTISLDYSPTDTSFTTYIVFAYTDDTYEYTNKMIQGGHYSFTSRSEKVLTGIAFSFSSGQIISLSNIQLEAGSTATTYEPYQGITVPDLLPEGTDLRSLPDGTRDTLNLAYLRPSTREGWAWYSRELTRRVKSDDFTASITLDPIELPSVFGPNFTLWVTADATPQLTAEYIRNLSVSISDMQMAIADIISG